MIGDLFDSPWKILIVAAVIIVLFGSAKLPAAARSLGKSMRILKTEIKDMHEDETPAPSQSAVPAGPLPAPPPAPLPVAPQLVTAQQQLGAQQAEQARHGASS